MCASVSKGQLFEACVQPDFKDATTEVFTLEQHGLGLPDRSYYLEESKADAKAAYQKPIEAMLVLAGKKQGQYSQMRINETIPITYQLFSISD